MDHIKLNIHEREEELYINYTLYLQITYCSDNTAK